MQATGVNFLLGVSAPANASNAASPLEDNAGDNGFAQLLSDAGTDAGTGDAPTGRELASELAGAVNTNMLIAQEVPNAAATLKTLQSLLKTPIRSDAAAELLQKVDGQLAQLAADANANQQDAEAWQQMRLQLQQIKDGAPGKSLGDLLHVATNEPVSAERMATQTSPLMQRMVKWLQANFAKANDSQVEMSSENDPTAPDANATNSITPTDATLQSLQASMFRSADDTAEAAPAKEESKDDTVVEIIPLAQQVMTLPEWAEQMRNETVQSRPEIESAIPSMKLAENDGALPAVDLPGAPKAAAEIAAGDRSAFLKALQQTDSGEATHATDHLDEKKALVDNAQSSKDVDAGNNPILNPSLKSGHVATQTANAVQPAAVLAQSHLVNHAPIADQVHVAIRQASIEGVERITIQMEPAELGRVEVKMHTDAAGKTQLAFTIDKPETFDTLSRDARSLERSLQEAGIKADTGSMQFNLRQQPQGQLHSDLGQGQGQSQQQTLLDDEAETAAAGKVLSAGAITKNYRVNIHDGVDIRA